MPVLTKLVIACTQVVFNLLTESSLNFKICKHGITVNIYMGNLYEPALYAIYHKLCIFSDHDEGKSCIVMQYKYYSLYPTPFDPKTKTHHISCIY